jgi:hypothetical protein
VGAARQISVELDPSARAAVPAFIALLADERWLAPLATGVRPTVENLIPLMGYIKSQLRGWEAMIANLADTLNHGDSRGPWLQGFLDLTLGGATGSVGPCSSPVGLCTNAYPQPGDATDPQPYRKGQFPRLRPWHPR